MYSSPAEVRRTPLVIGWKVATLSEKVASVRYRALLPILALRDEQCEPRVFSTADLFGLRGLDALVIVKSFSAEDLLLAQEAHAREIPVILDLCDNIFAARYTGEEKTSPVSMFRLLDEYLSAVVVPTSCLAEEVQQRTDSRVAVHVVPDGNEDDSIRRESIEILLAAQKRGFANRPSRLARVLEDRLSYLRAASWQQAAHAIRLDYKRCKATVRRIARPRVTRVLRRVAKSLISFYRAPTPIPSNNDLGAFDPARKQVLWFGNHGAPHAAFGMLDLLLIRDDLEHVASQLPLQLVVVSNNPAKYRQHIAPMRLNSRYVEWSASTVEQELGRADVVVLPNNLDAFSRCKSANRAVLALSNRVPVVATDTEALAALRTCIEVDFCAGLKRYLQEPAHREEHLNVAQSMIDRNFSKAAIGQRWRHVLDTVVNLSVPVKDAELAVAINLLQDIELALPIFSAARRRGVLAEAWCSLSLATASPRVVATLRQQGVPVRVLPDMLQGVHGLPRSTVRALLGITESNLAPHGFTRQLVERANMAGIPTATMQHGFENVGLTYSDSVHDIRKISFKAKRIYIWGSKETLHANVSASTAKRCVSVGYPKSARLPSAPIEGLPELKPLIGIFENLHWHRYTEEYRDFFLDSVRYLAQTFTHVTFVIKPHDAGRWLTERYGGEPITLDNVLVIDPKDKRRAALSARQLMEHLRSVITTPSTIALDAARVPLPTAVVSHKLSLDKYKPLPLLRSTADWMSFVKASLDHEGRRGLVYEAERFVQRSLVSGDASDRIVEDLLSVSSTFQISPQQIPHEADG